MGRVLIFLLSTISLGLSFDLHHVDPCTNVWLTWANRTGTTDFCLSLAQVSDPFRTCLIGYPYVHLDDFRGYVNTPDLSNVLNSSYWQWRRNNSDGWCIKSSDWPVEQGAMLQQGLIQRLNFSNHLPFQELTLWGSFPPQGEWENISNRENCSNMSPEILPVNGTGVVYFGDSWTGYLIQDGHKETLDSLIHYQNVSGNSGHWNISMNTGTRDVANITGQCLQKSITASVNKIFLVQAQDLPKTPSTEARRPRTGWAPTLGRSKCLKTKRGRCGLSWLYL
ncbi:hypothetical protein Q9966_016527 [Columba livia]|nr:hypothetical protein Q9966_016527 [Columba livia]